MTWGHGCDGGLGTPLGRGVPVRSPGSVWQRLLAAAEPVTGMGRVFK